MLSVMSRILIIAAWATRPTTAIHVSDLEDGHEAAGTSAVNLLEERTAVENNVSFDSPKWGLSSIFGKATDVAKDSGVADVAGAKAAEQLKAAGVGGKEDPASAAAGGCSKDLGSGATCSFFGCDKSRGDTDCVGGKCVCKAGECAKDGKCEKEPEKGAGGVLGALSGLGTSIFGAAAAKGVPEAEAKKEAEHAMEMAKEIASKECPKDLGKSATCSFFSCDKTRGPTECKSGKCECQEGFCADALGKCNEAHSPEDKAPANAQCSRDLGAGATCNIGGCEGSRGPTTCENKGFLNNVCECKVGFCAKEGKCEPAVTGAAPPAKQAAAPPPGGGPGSGPGVQPAPDQKQAAALPGASSSSSSSPGSSPGVQVAPDKKQAAALPGASSSSGGSDCSSLKAKLKDLQNDAEVSSSVKAKLKDLQNDAEAAESSPAIPAAPGIQAAPAEKQAAALPAAPDPAKEAADGAARLAALVADQSKELNDLEVKTSKDVKDCKEGAAKELDALKATQKSVKDKLL